jgi:hypothetical protein
VRQPAPEVAHQGQGQRHQAARDPAGLHQGPGEEKQGNRQQHKIVHPGDEPLGEHQQVGPPEPLERDERGEPQRHCQGGVQHQQPEEPDEQHPGRGEVRELGARDVQEQRAAHPEPACPCQHGAQDPPRQGREMPHGKEARRRDAEGTASG